jgi:hypothetical protein
VSYVVAITKRQFGFVEGCLKAGHDRVVAVSPDPKQLRELAAKVHASVSLAEAMKVSYLTPCEFVAELKRVVEAEKSGSQAAAKQRKKERDVARRDNPFHPREEQSDKGTGT